MGLLGSRARYAEKIHSQSSAVSDRTARFTKYIRRHVVNDGERGRSGHSKAISRGQIRYGSRSSLLVGQKSPEIAFNIANNEDMKILRVIKINFRRESGRRQ